MNPGGPTSSDAQTPPSGVLVAQNRNSWWVRNATTSGASSMLDRALADPSRDVGDARAALDGELALVKQLVGGEPAMAVGCGRGR